MIDESQFQSEMKQDGTLSVSYKGYEFDFDIGFKKEKIEVPKTDKNGNTLDLSDRNHLRSYLYDHYKEICVYPTQVLINPSDVNHYLSKIKSDQEAGEKAFLDYHHKNYTALIAISILYIIMGFFVLLSENIREKMDLFFFIVVFFSIIMVGISLFYFFRKGKVKKHHYYSCEMLVYDCFYYRDDNGERCGVRVRIWDGEKYLINQWLEAGNDWKSIQHGTKVILYISDDNELLIKKED